MELELTKLAEYNIWVGTRVRKIMTSLTEDEFTRELQEPFTPPLNSIQTIALHISQGLEFCYSVAQGLTYADFKDIRKQSSGLNCKAFLEYWEKVDQQFLHFAQNIVVETVTLGGREKAGFPLATQELFFHFLNHANYHRGQLLLALKTVGKGTIGTDYLVYLRQLAKKDK